MSEAQSLAAKEAWARRKAEAAEAAAAQANAAAEAIPDQPIEPKQQDEPAPAPKVDHSLRLQALEQIRERRQLQEEGKVNDEDEEVEPTHEAEPPEPQDYAAVVEPAAAPEMVRVNVYGDELDVPKADVDAAGGKAAYQQIKASERLFQQAKESERRAAEMLAAVGKATAPPPAPAKPLLDVVKENIQKIQFGSPEEAAAAWNEIEEAKKASQPQFDPVRVKQEAVAEFFQQQAMRTFIAKNPDIMGDPVTAQLAALVEGGILAKGQPQDWNKHYENLEVVLRNRLGKQTSAPAVTATSQPTSGSVADKEARKASIVALPVTAAKAVPPEEPKPKTREETLAQLRKARGQAV